MGAVQQQQQHGKRAREEATIKTTICAKFKHVLPAAKITKTTTTTRTTTEAAVTTTNAQ